MGAMKIGVITLPVFAALVAVLVAFVARGALPHDISLTIALLAVGGFTCAEIGRRLPLVASFGGAAIFATFVPSWLVYMHWLPINVVDTVRTFTKDSQFLYLYIAAIIVGSVLSMDRQVLLKGFPIEAAIVTGCRASQGGTDDVAILTAAGRLQLMPFAQISTRIGCYHNAQPCGRTDIEVH